MKVNSQQVILSNYIKFNRLNELCSAIFSYEDKNNIKTIDIYIDLYSVLSSLYNGSYDPALDKDDFSIAAGIINMIAHYRSFFRSNNIDTRFFFVYSDIWSIDKTKLVPEYDFDMKFKMDNNPEIYNLIHQNLNIVIEMVKYINNSALLYSSIADTSVLIYYLMIGGIDYCPNNYKIIITKDIVVNQVCAYVPKTVIFRPKKYNGEDASYFVSALNGGLYNNLATVFKNKYQDPGLVSAGLYSFVLAATKVPNRGIKSLIGYKTLMNELNTLFGNDSSNQALNSYNYNVKYICKHLSANLYIKLQHGNINGRFSAIDAIKGYDEYITRPEKSIYRGIQNLYDPNGLHQIDTEYFSNWHLNFENM